MGRVIATLVLVAVCGPAVASADSDGYYCIGPGYLAYQLGFAAPPVAHHRLHIVRFGSSGLRAPIAFDLPQFQVHGIACSDRTVRLAAFDAIHTVYLDEESRPLRHDAVERTDVGRTPPEFVGHSDNLGAWSRVVRSLKTDRITLGGDDRGGQYLLEIRGTDIKSARCTTMVTTRILRVDHDGRQVQQLQLFQGRAPRTCGE